MNIQKALVMGGLTVKVGDKVTVTYSHNCGQNNCEWPHEITKTAEVRAIDFEGDDLLTFKTSAGQYFSVEPQEVVRIRKAS